MTRALSGDCTHPNKQISSWNAWSGVKRNDARGRNSAKDDVVIRGKTHRDRICYKRLLRKPLRIIV